jgi:hypothetical protein
MVVLNLQKVPLQGFWEMTRREAAASRVRAECFRRICHGDFLQH